METGGGGRSQVDKVMDNVKYNRVEVQGQEGNDSKPETSSLVSYMP